jgi:hypothetical protein
MRDRYGMSTNLEDAEAALGAIVDSELSGGSCGKGWRHQLTPVVKYCRVVVSDRRPVLQVNPAWMCELMEQDRLWLLVDEIRTWDAINEAVSYVAAQDRRRPG